MLYPSAGRQPRQVGFRLSFRRASPGAPPAPRTSDTAHQNLHQDRRWRAQRGPTAWPGLPISSRASAVLAAYSSTTEADLLSKPSAHRLGTVALSSTLFLYEEGEQVLRPERLGDEGDHARVAHGTFTGFARHRRGEHGYLQAPNGVEKVQDVEAAHPRHFEIEQENAWKHALFCCSHHLSWAGEVFDGGDGHGVTDDPPRQEPVDLTVIDKPNTHEVDLPPCPRSRTAQNRPEQHVSLGKPPQTVCRRARSNEPHPSATFRTTRYAGSPSEGHHALAKHHGRSPNHRPSSPLPSPVAAR